MWRNFFYFAIYVVFWCIASLLVIPFSSIIDWFTHWLIYHNVNLRMSAVIKTKKQYTSLYSPLCFWHYTSTNPFIPSPSCPLTAWYSPNPPLLPRSVTFPLNLRIKGKWERGNSWSTGLVLYATPFNPSLSSCLLITSQSHRWAI